MDPDLWHREVEPALKVCFKPAEERSASIPPLLLHFTTTNGLLKILSERQFRLGRARCLNDTREIEHGLGIAREELERLRSPSVAFEVEKEFSDAAIDVVNYRFKSTPHDQMIIPVLDAHIACFTEPEKGNEDGSLLHWAMYGNNGDGFALGFNFGNVSIAELRKVSYDDGEQRTEISGIIKCFQTCPSYRSAPRYFGAWCGSVLVFAAAWMKHSSLSSEHEWRLITWYTTVKNQEKKQLRMRFTEGPSMVKSYFNYPFKPEALRRIVIGHKINDEPTRETLQILLHERRYPSSVEIRKSPISLR